MLGEFAGHLLIAPFFVSSECFLTINGALVGSFAWRIEPAPMRVEPFIAGDGRSDFRRAVGLTVPLKSGRGDGRPRARWSRFAPNPGPLLTLLCMEMLASQKNLIQHEAGNTICPYYYYRLLSLDDLRLVPDGRAHEFDNISTSVWLIEIVLGLQKILLATEISTSQS